MLSNTACCPTRPLNFSTISVEKHDPFTLVDGRYIGHDGFVVPRNFDEFYERYPDYVRSWVKRHVARSTPTEDLEDWTQDLLMHMRYLPTTSKHLRSGKEDVVQTFDPTKRHGANAARFFSYINLCLTNKFRAIHSKRTKNPICRPGNSSFQWNAGDSGQMSYEFCLAQSGYLRSRGQQQERQRNAVQALSEFRKFVMREDPTVLPFMNAIAKVETFYAAAALLGSTEHYVCRTWSRLRTLGRCFQNGEPIPKPPRRYSRRRMTGTTPNRS